jgi:soluble lytic murein transglycosylase
MLLADLYFRVGLPVPALRALNAVLQEVEPSERPRLPVEFWTSLFPQFYWEEVQDSARRSQLDPFLILGVVRQESAFNPGAISRADARGLMQLLPSTGRELFQRLGLGPFRPDVLFDPQVNVRLGAHYLGRLADAHQGNLVLALAAYNAGPARVQRWLQDMTTRDWDEFVEGIPFEETRGYIKNVLRNYGMYRKLYGLGDGTTDGHR